MFLSYVRRLAFNWLEILHKKKSRRISISQKFYNIQIKLLDIYNKKIYIYIYKEKIIIIVDAAKNNS